MLDQEADDSQEAGEEAPAEDMKEAKKHESSKKLKCTPVPQNWVGDIPANVYDNGDATYDCFYKVDVGKVTIKSSRTARSSRSRRASWWLIRTQIRTRWASRTFASSLRQRTAVGRSWMTARQSLRSISTVSRAMKRTRKTRSSTLASKCFVLFTPPAVSGERQVNCFATVSSHQRTQLGWSEKE